MIDKLYTIKVIFNQYRCIKIVPRKEKLGINFSLQQIKQAWLYKFLYDFLTFYHIPHMKNDFYLAHSKIAYVTECSSLENGS